MKSIIQSWKGIERWKGIENREEKKRERRKRDHNGKKSSCPTRTVRSALALLLKPKMTGQMKGQCDERGI